MNSPCLTGLVMWKVKLVPGEMNHPREIPGGQAWSQASCRVAPKGNGDKKTAQLVNSLPQPRTGPPRRGISRVSSGWRPAWWLASLPCPSCTSKRRVWFFLHCSPRGSHFQRQRHLPSWLASPPNVNTSSHSFFWKTSGSVEGREQWNGNAQHSLREAQPGCMGQEDKSVPRHRQARQVSWGEQELLTCLSVCPSMLSIPLAGPELQPLLLWGLQASPTHFVYVFGPRLRIFLGCISSILVLTKDFPLLSNMEETKLMRLENGAIFNHTTFPRRWKTTSPFSMEPAWCSSDPIHSSEMTLPHLCWLGDLLCSIKPS